MQPYIELRLKSTLRRVDRSTHAGGANPTPTRDASYYPTTRRLVLLSPPIRLSTSTHHISPTPIPPRIGGVHADTHAADEDPQG